MAIVLLVVTGGANSIVVTGGSVSAPGRMVQPREAGDRSTCGPAGSMARTTKVWKPRARLVSWTGEVHGAQSAPSVRHSKVAPARSEVNSNVALVFEVSGDGPATIVVSGAGTTVHRHSAGVGSKKPASS